MLHTYNCIMTDKRTANLLGALALALADGMSEEVEARAEHGTAAPAALVTIGISPGGSINALAQTIGLTHSATVRLVDRLAADELVERRGGEDRRTVGLYLTRSGIARRRAILKGRNKILAKALSPLCNDQKTMLTELMEILLRGLTQNRIHADIICRLCDEDVCPQEDCPVESAVLKT